MARLFALLIGLVVFAGVPAPTPAFAHAGHREAAFGAPTNVPSVAVAGRTVMATSKVEFDVLAWAAPPRDVLRAGAAFDVAAASRLDAPNATLPVRCPDDHGAPCSCRIDTLLPAPGGALVAACGTGETFVLSPPPERPLPRQHPIAVPTDRVGAVSARGPPALHQHD